jgi:hypothetical protein
LLHASRHDGKGIAPQFVFVSAQCCSSTETSSLPAGRRLENWDLADYFSIAKNYRPNLFEPHVFSVSALRIKQFGR